MLISAESIGGMYSLKVFLSRVMRVQEQREIRGTLDKPFVLHKQAVFVTSNKH